MTVYNIVPGAKGPHGKGTVILAWRALRWIEAGDSTSVTRYLYRFTSAGIASTASDERTKIYVDRVLNAYKFGAKFMATPAVATKCELYINGAPTGNFVTLSNTTASIISISVPIASGDYVEVVGTYTTGTPSATNTFPQAVLLLE